MSELRKTPERLPVADVNEGLDTSSPLKPLNRPVAGHNAEEVAERTMPTALREISVEAMWKMLVISEEDMDRTFTRLPNIPEVTSKESNQYKRYVLYLNSLSESVHAELVKRGYQSEKVITFFDRHSIPPKDHATGTTNRPDFLALKTASGDPAPLVFNWSALEATGELLSDDDREHSRAKTAAYTSYHLQARPDMVTVQGIYIDPTGFRLVVSNACGAFDTKYLLWKDRPSRLLLCAWIWRLYEPFVDPSITANIERDKRITFNITLPEGTSYPNCTIHSVGNAFGRRTTVLTCPKPEVVIKEQYIETSRRFGEGPILTKIHKKGTFPGVVRPGWYGPVESSKEEELVVRWKGSERKKTRVILLDKAPSIMDAKTLQEALVAMYDLLEITRFLHKKRKILHRDISCNNVLLRDVGPPETSSADNDSPETSADNDPLAAAVPPETSSPENDLAAAVPAKDSIAKELEDMCFASYLLRTKSNSESVLSSKVLPSAHFYNTSPSRLDTGVLLIDFDMSEDQELGNQGDDKKAPHSRTGTPTFIARAVVSGMKKEGIYNLVPMPQLDPENKEAYQAAVPKRLEDFPPNKLESYQIPKDVPLRPFKHKLQYDVESVFWLLLWWAIHACPVASPDHRHIDHRHWNALTDEQDAKTDPRGFFLAREFPKGFVHPVYEPLETLLRGMAQQLYGDHDHEGIDDQWRKQDDYLHEAFQRLIFNFLFTNYDKGFMTAMKDSNPRKPAEAGPPMKGPLASHQINKVRASASAPSAPSSSQNVQSSSARDLRSSSSSHKRRRLDQDASDSDPNDSDPNDGEYVNNSKRRRHK